MIFCPKYLQIHVSFQKADNALVKPPRGVMSVRMPVVVAEVTAPLDNVAENAGNHI